MFQPSCQLDKIAAYEDVNSEEDPGADVGRDDVPLHAVDVGQLAEETEPVVHQGCHAPGLLRDFAHSEGFKQKKLLQHIKDDAQGYR